MRKGAAFIFGWLLSLATVIAFAVLVTRNKPQAQHDSSLAALAAELAIGAGLLVIAIRQYRKLDKPKPPKRSPGRRRASTT
jgi:Sap, sulfolipid-1-addressing protein